MDTGLCHPDPCSGSAGSGQPSLESPQLRSCLAHSHSSLHTPLLGHMHPVMGERGEGLALWSPYGKILKGLPVSGLPMGLAEAVTETELNAAALLPLPSAASHHPLSTGWGIPRALPNPLPAPDIVLFYMKLFCRCPLLLVTLLKYVTVDLFLVLYFVFSRWDPMDFSTKRVVS